MARCLVLVAVLALFGADTALGMSIFQNRRNISIRDFIPGQHIWGPVPGQVGSRGKIILLQLMPFSRISEFDTLVRWQGKYAGQNLLIIAVRTDTTDPQIIRRLCRDRGFTHTVYSTGVLKDDDQRYQPSMQTIIFDHTGRCVYRGSIFGADEALRNAMRMVLRPSIDDLELHKLKKVGRELDGGASLQSVIGRLNRYLKSRDDRLVGEARLILDRMNSFASELIEEAHSLSEQEPYECSRLLKRITVDFEGLSAADTANKILKEYLAQDKFRYELEAAAAFHQLRDLESTLRPANSARDRFNVHSQSFRETNRHTLSRMKALVHMMLLRYPDSPFTKEASELAREYGLL